MTDASRTEIQELVRAKQQERGEEKTSLLKPSMSFVSSLFFPPSLSHALDVAPGKGVFPPISFLYWLISFVGNYQRDSHTVVS